MTTAGYRTLKAFLLTKMRMSHIYQPLMIRTLLTNGGRANTRTIAATFLSKDESQIEYYEQITKSMPGKVLAKHGIVERAGDDFLLTASVAKIQPDEITELIRLCDQKLEEYLAKRGDAIFAHRFIGAGYVPGSIRYEVLKRAGGRCELCGVPHEERALEVDHVVPKKHGGPDDVSNYQALCWKCNANKGARDATDFREWKKLYGKREQGCPFCDLESSRIVAENALAFAIRDAYPVSGLHTLIIPKRHVKTYFDLFSSERRAIEQLLDSERKGILGLDGTVEGFNIGANAGAVAGQTVMHCHIHMIPRRRGDTENPRGGVRHVIPGKGFY